MNLEERQRQFLEAIQRHFGTSKSVRPRELFGVSNGARILEGGIQLGVVNLDNVKDDVEALIFACVLRFPPEDEVYFAVLIRKDRANFLARLAEMKRLAATTKAGAPDATFALEPQGSDADSLEPAGGQIKYSERNNLVPVYIAQDGKLWLRNSGFWNTLKFDLAPFGPPTIPDEIAVALHPPTASARRSLLAREFIGWLGNLVGHEKIHEVPVWADAGSLGPNMRRMPTEIGIEDLEGAVRAQGGHYPNGEVRRLHAALNFLSHKHFVILSGLSGTGKTQLALKYARAVHGLESRTDRDPLIFECAVRPEWTDPSGVMGYFDVLTNRYVVPTFLEAVLVAIAHRESPVFVILDEMNLARIEYYFSEVLSALETRGYLQLHSNGVPLEGTTGTSVRAQVPLPENLFIVGTINVDETTNAVSDKVLDRASVIEMSSVDVPGFLESLVSRYPDLAEARSMSEATLIDVHGQMHQHGIGFGYRTIEEFVRYYAFDAKYMMASSGNITDHLLLQKIFVKLRGTERQRGLLNNLEKLCKEFPSSLSFIRKLINELDEFGSFQAMR